MVILSLRNEEGRKLAMVSFTVAVPDASAAFAPLADQALRFIINTRLYIKTQPYRRIYKVTLRLWLRLTNSTYSNLRVTDLPIMIVVERYFFEQPNLHNDRPFSHL